MKNKTDWIVIGAALGIGYLLHVILTVESLILPAFVGVILLHLIVSRVARHS